MQRTELDKLLNSLPESDLEPLLTAASSDLRFRREMRAISILPIFLLLVCSVLSATLISHFSPGLLVRLIICVLPLLCFFASIRFMFPINEWNLRRSVVRQLVKRNRYGL
jgi:hypothetical protein